MSTTWFHKPESALKRANELIAIGNKDGALELLQGVFAARRYKQWQKAYETLMIKFLDLCVELQRHREAKDGLHQYRNMAQQQAPGSLEVIITHLLDMSEGRATNAKMKANAISAEEVTQIGDLEAEASPESIMLSTMTEEGGKERTDREVVVPWLKFLWEAYRAVLDILKTNTKLEHVYHNTCIKAFNFCRTYARTTEFRRLCDTLRQHISNLQRHTGAAAATRLRGWEGWTSEGIELHLQTRFAQLEVAANLELWTEGFRTVEDIYNIMQIGKKVPKARLMASYYEKLTRIFLVSENHLFHAYAWYKYYTLSREYNKALTAEERTQQACCVLLAALAIPEVKARSAGGDGGAAYNDDDLTKEKNQRMATLLGFNTDPSRSALLQELVAKGLLAQVPPPLRLLYAQLEVSSSPLSIVKATAPAFEFLRAEANTAVLGVYCAQLERMVVLRMLEGLASIYQTVSLAKFKGYLAGLEMDFQEVEKLVVRAAKSKDIQVAVDYQVQCLRFTPAVMETEGMRSQLTSLARQLNDVVTLIGGFDAKGITDAGAIVVKEADSAAARHSFFAKVSSHVETEHAAALRRKEVIEKRKEEAERREQEKAREAARLKAEEEARRREEEASRLAREAKLREREKLQRMEDELALAETKNVLKELGKKVENLETMDKAAREIAIKTAKDEILTEKEKEEKRMKDQAKRMDYIVRAMRMEEAPVLQQKFAAQQEADQADHARRVEEYRVKHRLEWEESIKQKAALAKMQSYRSAFEAQVLQDRRAGFEQEVRRAEEAARERHRQNKIDRAARRKQQAEDDELAAREAEAQRLHEEEEERERKAAEDKKVEQDRAAAAAAKEAAAARRAPDEDGWQQARGGGARGGDDREVRFGGAESRDGPAPSRADTASTWRRGGGGGFDDRGGGGGAARGGFEERGGGGGGRFEGGGGGRALEERFGGGRGGFEERGGGARDMDGGRGGGFEDRGGRGGLDERRGPPPADSERSWRRSGPPAAGPPGKEDGGSGPPAGQRPRWGMGRSLADLEKSGL